MTTLNKKMTTSIFTPTNDTQFLNEAYDSFKSQHFFEWVLLFNNCEVPTDKKLFPFLNDERVKIFSLPVTDDGYNIGFLKNHVCNKCTGDLLLELDHDDLLDSSAIKDVEKVFNENPNVGFVYSNAANFKGDFQKTQRYNEAIGWKYRTIGINDVEEHIAWEANPFTLSRIWFTPNHVRVWKSEVYHKIGGHDESLRVLDDQDLIVRTYLETDFYHIDKCLYLYRITGNNNWIKYNKEIQQNLSKIQNKYFHKTVIKWAKKKNLRLLDLGGRFHKQVGFENVDKKDADVTCDLNETWPFETNSVGVLRAFDLMEHLVDKLHFIKEAYRVLAPGGYLLSMTPSTDGRGAFQDPTHVSFYNENSFKYYIDDNFKKYIDSPVHFQSAKLLTTAKDKDEVCWVIADLIAIKVNESKIPKINFDI